MTNGIRKNSKENNFKDVWSNFNQGVNTKRDCKKTIK